MEGVGGHLAWVDLDVGTLRDVLLESRGNGEVSVTQLVVGLSHGNIEGFLVSLSYSLHGLFDGPVVSDDLFSHPLAIVIVVI